MVTSFGQIKSIRTLSVLVAFYLGTGCDATLKTETTSNSRTKTEDRVLAPEDEHLDQEGEEEIDDAKVDKPVGIKDLPAVYKLIAPPSFAEYPIIFKVKADAGIPVESFSASNVTTSGFSNVITTVEKITPLEYSVRIEAVNRTGNFTVAISHSKLTNTSELQFSGSLAVTSNPLLQVSVWQDQTAILSPFNLEEKPVPSDWIYTLKIENKMKGALLGLRLEGTGVHLVSALPSTLATDGSLEQPLHVEFLPNRLQASFDVYAGSTLLQHFEFGLEDPVVPLVWMDASDLTTLFSDRSCTTPVTELSTAVGCWSSKGSVNASVSAFNDASLLSWAKSSNLKTDVPAVVFVHQRPLLSSTVIRSEAGPAHLFVTFTRPAIGVGHHWQRILSFFATGEGCTNDGVGVCTSFASDWTGGGGPAVVAPQVAENHYDSDKKLLNFNMGFNAMFGSEFLEGEVGEVLVFGRALSHEQIFAVRRRLARIIGSDSKWIFPPTYFP